MRTLLAVAGSALMLAPVAVAQGTGPEYLFSTDADDVTITRHGSGYQISLDAKNRVTRFTDRPYRKASTMSLRDFARNWKAYGFAQDPPNAALLLENGSETRTSVVEMTRPRIAGGRASFRLTQIRVSASVSAAGYRHRHALRARTYDHAALFIDGSGWTMTITTEGQYTLGAEDEAKFDLPTGNDYDIFACGYDGGYTYKLAYVSWNGGADQRVGTNCWTTEWSKIPAETINTYTMTGVTNEVTLGVQAHWGK